MEVGLLRRNLACGRGLHTKEHNKINFLFFSEKKKRFRGMQDDYRLRPNVWCSSIAINFSARHLQTL